MTSVKKIVALTLGIAFISLLSQCKKERVDLPVDISFYARVDTTNVVYTLFFNGKDEGAVPLGVFGCDDAGALVIQAGAGDHTYKVKNSENEVEFEGVLHIKKRLKIMGLQEPITGQQQVQTSYYDRRIRCIAVEFIAAPHKH